MTTEEISEITEHHLGSCCVTDWELDCDLTECRCGHCCYCLSKDYWPDYKPKQHRYKTNEHNNRNTNE